MLKAKTLLVDDEADLRKSLHEELAFDGWDVDEAENGSVAIQMLEKQSYDVVIADVRMPIMDGWSLLRHVREKDLRTTFVIMSAYADTPPWEPYALGADALVGKPFRISDLEELMRRMRKPMLERWGEGEGSQAHWDVAGQIEVDIRKHPENFSLGRGGMFVSTEMQSIRKGAVVSFCVTTTDFQLEGIGKVRWKRGSEVDGLAPGLGVEFLYLKDSCRSRITQAIAKSKEKAFIPRGTLLK